VGHPFDGRDMGKQRNVPTTIEKHPKRDEIEAALAAGTPLSRLRQRYGMSESALCRYRQGMRRDRPELFEALTAAKWKVTPDEMNALRTEMSDGFLKILYLRHAKLSNAEDRNLEAGNDGVAAQFAGRIQKNLDLIGAVVKQIGHDTVKIQQNILILPEFHAFRTAMLEELRDHPEIRARVLRRARELGEAGQQTITLSAGRAA